MAVTDKRLWAQASRHFRKRRNAELGRIIASLDRPRILDVGGMPSFWTNVPGWESASLVHIINSEAGEHSTVKEMTSESLQPNMTVSVGDACDLDFQDREFDLVVCNSVLEHVSGWANVEAAARELTRVGKHGWVQVPAYEFPLEVHYMRPFVHWFAEPTRAALLRMSGRRFRKYDAAGFRNLFLFVQLLTKGEMRYLFPEAEIRAERFLGMRKSTIALW